MAGADGRIEGGEFLLGCPPTRKNFRGWDGEGLDHVMVQQLERLLFPYRDRCPRPLVIGSPVHEEPTHHVNQHRRRYPDKSPAIGGRRSDKGKEKEDKWDKAKEEGEEKSSDEFYKPRVEGLRGNQTSRGGSVGVISGRYQPGHHCWSTW